jgi:hypothetical protein
MGIKEKSQEGRFRACVNFDFMDINHKVTIRLRRTPRKNTIKRVFVSWCLCGSIIHTPIEGEVVFYLTHVVASRVMTFRVMERRV